VREACAEAAPTGEIGIRWPNDVVTADGRKLAGLLLETTLAGDRLADAVIGAGINVNWARGEMPAEIAARATSLAELAGRPIDRVTLLGGLLARLDDEVRSLEAGRSPVERFAAASVLDGRAIRVEVGDGALEGVAAGISPDGALLLDTPGGRVAMAVGEVVAVRDRPAEVPA
jgi:BirA family biotin operon repressor/biotin-[acetyl-CoA-carboxylase] ligase